MSDANDGTKPQDNGQIPYAQAPAPNTPAYGQPYGQPQPYNQQLPPTQAMPAPWQAQETDNPRSDNRRPPVSPSSRSSHSLRRRRHHRHHSMERPPRNSSP